MRTSPFSEHADQQVGGRLTHTAISVYIYLEGFTRVLCSELEKSIYVRFSRRDP